MKIFLTALTLGFTVLISEAYSDPYKGKLTCKLLYEIMSPVPDANIPGFCQNAQTFCFSKDTVHSLPQNHPLQLELNQSENYSNTIFAICEAGIMKFAPELYKDKLSR